MITCDEWLAYVATDPQLRLVPNSATHTVILNIKSLFSDPWLRWYEGEIQTTGPDEWVIAKMLLIASALNARVEGEECQTYSPALYRDYIAKLTIT